MAGALWLLPRFAPWFFGKVGHRVSEPETKFVALVLLGLGGLATIAGSEAVLPAYLVGMALAPAFLADPELPHRMRIIAFTILTPFYFLKAGSLVDFQAVLASAGLITIFLAIKWLRSSSVSCRSREPLTSSPGRGCTRLSSCRPA